MRTALCVLFMPALAASLFLPPAVPRANAGLYTEDFTTTAYRDPSQTTALWDTADGELKLHPFEMSVVGSYPTTHSAQAIAVAGDIAYVGGNLAGLQILDVSDPAAPTLLGSYDTPGQAVDVALKGDLAFIADTAAGLCVLDVSDPTSPDLVGTYVGTDVLGVAVAGHYAFLGAPLSGLIVLDIADPAHPVAVGSCPAISAGRLTVSGNYAYVACRYAGTVQVIDISDPTTPVPAATYNVGAYAHEVAVSGDRAYVTHRVAAWGMDVLDVSDPTLPVQVGSCGLPVHAGAVGISGDRAYVTGGGAGTQSWLFEIDISDPSTPTVLNSCLLPGSDATGIALDGCHALVAGAEAGLQLVKIAEPTNPTLLATLDTPSGASWVALHGDYAFIADYMDGLRVIDISDPANPVGVGAVDTPGAAHCVVVDGDYAYVADAQAGLQVVDVTDPTVPTIVGSLPSIDSAGCIEVAGDYAYIADQTGGLRVIDIQDPTHPVALGRALTSDNAIGLAVCGDYAYVTARYAGLIIIDVSDSAHPVVVGSLDTPGYCYGVAVAGDYAYVADGYSGLAVIDISDPVHPSLVRTVPTSAIARGVTLDGDFVYVGDSSGLLYVVDVRVPSTAYVSRSILLPEWPVHAPVADDYAFVACSWFGLQVVEVLQRKFDTESNVGQSVDIGSFDQLVGRARVTTTQTNLIDWQLSADGGSHWEGVPHNGAWHDFASLGNDLLWRSEHSYAGGGVNPTCSHLEVEWELTPNIVCDPTPLALSVSEPTGDVDVKFLGGGSGPIYGYSLKFTWDGAVAHTSAAADSVMQGSLLSSIGTTFFDAVRTGDHEITVDCALLGYLPGAAGPGTMFTIRFAGVSFGTSPVHVTLLEARDRDNQPLTGFLEEDGLVRVDVQNPSVTEVFIDNLTLSHTDDFIKNTDAVRVTATVTDDDPTLAIGNIKADLTGLGGGASVGPDSYDSGVATWQSMLAGVTTNPLNGTVVVTVTATDPMGNVAAESDSIHADNRKPTAVTAFDASPGHEKCALSWTNGTDTYLAGVTVRRLGNAEYPQYPMFRAAWPGVDAYYPANAAAGVEAYNGTGASATDAVTTRDIYYYQAFCYDQARNYSVAASTARDLATNYWLGDVANVANNWLPDGYVSDPDIAKLSGAYRLSSPGAPSDQCDVGPTVHPDGNRLGLPKPDRQVQFEDLMIFAMNYARVAPKIVPLLSEPGGEALALSLRELSAGADGEVQVALRLAGNTSEVKGLSAAVTYDPAQIEFVTARLADAMLSAVAPVFFWEGATDGRVQIDLAVLGTDVTIGGSGDVAVFTFRALSEQYALGFDGATIRGAENEDLIPELEGLDAAPQGPTAFALLQNAPNPFNPVTTVRYDVPSESDVTIRVYDVAGREVRTLVDGRVPAGHREAVWDGRNDAGEAVGSGVYFCVMEAEGYRGSQKIALLK